MKEDRLKAKLEEYQVFVIRNVYATDTSVLKTFLKKMVEDKITSKAIEILEYIKEHKGDNIKSMALGKRFDVFERGSVFYNYTGSVIDDILEDIEDRAEQSKQPQQLEQLQDDGVCPADSDVPSVGGVSPDDGKEQSKQPQQLEDLENKRKFAEHILIQDKLGLLEELHNLLDNKIGKYVAMTIRAAVEVGVMSRPYFPEVKAEFVEVGNKSGYNAYYNKVEAYDQNDFEYVKEKLLKYKKVEN